MDRLNVAQVFVDGVSSVATHNGVHRITFFRLAADGKPHPEVELIIPASATNPIIDALGKLRR